ncbi:MAG TPA: trehalose-6-phosphate synthase [Acidimicrobiales bacterium]|nr:trehalose-6-phosphate synthase [Acidimicrobiales bacterium]
MSGPAATADLVVVSNRGPFTFVAEPDGSITARPGGGGLAPSLAAALAGTGGSTWVAAALSEADRRSTAAGSIESAQPGLSLRFVALEAEVLAAAYDAVANAVLWFVYHGLFDAPRRPVFDDGWLRAWEGFRVYNRAFAAAVAEVAAPGGVVLVNDYHLPLVGAMLAGDRPDLRTVHFSHTPFASVEELAMLPHAAARELLEGMAGFGACGFHTARWERAFRRCAAEAGGSVPETFVAPLGPDLARLQEVAATAECAERRWRLQERLGGRRLLLRNDRVELSKNLLRGLRAFDLLLAEHPEWRRSVVHVIRAYPSREMLPEYLAYRSEVEHLAAVVNERWSEGGHEPVVVDVDDDFASTVAALGCYDVLLVNPVRDGMNLVAKEGPALNERDGMLVLSEQAGAYEELGPEAFGVQPFDVSQTARAIHEALSIEGPARSERALRLRRLAVAHPPAEWLQRLLSKARVPSSRPAGG